MGRPAARVPALPRPDDSAAPRIPVNPPPNPTDPLFALRDIHAPDAPGLWPPAPGWAAVCALAAVAVIAAAFITARRWRAGRARREALVHLRTLRARHEAGAPCAEIAMELSTLVRRVALSRCPREEVAGLADDRWIAWLESSLPGIGAAVRTALLDAPYARERSFDVPRALAACERWIRRV